MWQQVELALKESAHRALVTLANFLPGILALLIVVILLTLIGALVAALLRRLLTSMRFDERLARNTVVPLSDWAPSHSPTLLITRTFFWGCVILGFIIGILAFDSAYSGNFQVSILLLAYLTHSVGAVILLILGTLIARFLSRSVLIGAVNQNLQYARFLSLGVKWMVLVITAAMVLDHLQIGGTIVGLAFGILFGGIVLTLSLAVGLGSREIVSRSLEKNVDRPLDTMPPESDYRPSSTETLRHF
ncbi:hypothetical protein [Edaphobacter aggregans]|uniref:hypothetical protein n=1 Tax=Edaphobacter aggregans TaxID=570835 RepID=UPI000556851E|nr:hypothetical protein [Edaphobacter aggregans]